MNETRDEATGLGASAQADGDQGETAPAETTQSDPGDETPTTDQARDDSEA